ncbi:MAG: AF1514 family protein [bacterium]|nr:AF1514 family protein [bacterium]
MKKLELNVQDESLDFIAAEKLADSKAEDELGDCIRLGWYNDELKLVAPADLLGSKESPEQGIVTFAESRGAEMEIDVLGGRYRFYYKKFDD